MTDLPARAAPPDFAPEPAASTAPQTAAGMAPARPLLDRRLPRLGLVLLIGVLLYLALRNAPFREILRVLAGLHIWQLALVLALDALIYCLVTARWWFVVRSVRPGVSLPRMMAMRLSAFALSYFTLGPQIGGEPLQVAFLRRRYGLTYTRATASVVMDKLFELLANFVLLGVGVVAVFRSGMLSAVAISPVPLVVLGLLISWPVAHITLLCYHVYPSSALLRLIARGRRKNKLVRFIGAAERLAGQFCQRHPGYVFGSAVVSLLAAAATVSEYALIASFLSVGLPFWQLVTAWSGGWLSFLVPLPGGLGVLEASQVSILGLFGVPAATAISLALVLRGRDLVIGGLGLILAGHAAAWR